MNGIETLRYLNKKYANNGVKFENTGTAIKITNEKNDVIYLNENPKNEKEADYLVKLNVQGLFDGMSKNRQLQKFAFSEDEVMKYIEHFHCAGFNKRFCADVEKANIYDEYFGHTVTFIESRKYNYCVTLYDIDIDYTLAKELVKFEEMFDRISQNKKVYFKVDSDMVNVFYNDKSVYEIDMLRERAEEVEKYLKNKLKI